MDEAKQSIASDEAYSEVIHSQRVQEHQKQCAELTAIYSIKNRKYRDSYHRTYTEYGNPVICLRLEDKFLRLKALVLHGEEGTSDESIEDTLLDMANYAIMARMELRLKREAAEPKGVSRLEPVCADSFCADDKREAESGDKE